MTARSLDRARDDGGIPRLRSGQAPRQCQTGQESFCERHHSAWGVISKTSEVCFFGKCGCSARGTPIQPPGAEGVEGTVELLPQYADGLKDPDGLPHIILIYRSHLSRPSPLQAKPFMVDEVHGVSALRGPGRPNAIRLPFVRREAVEGLLLRIRDVDIVDGTPLPDVKPYVPEFDARDVDCIGWLDRQVPKLPTTQHDGRFAR